MSLSPAEIEARLRLAALPQLGPRRQRQLLAAFETASAALSAPASAWRALGLSAETVEARRLPEIRERALHALRWLDGPGRQLRLFDQPDYPALLGELADAPPLLFVEGDAALLDAPQLALVGSRRASAPGLANARRFAGELARAGFVVTSGLALGIDGAAHQGALDVGGRTLAVLGTGLEVLYPRRHAGLAAQILECGGALVSELLPDAPPLAQHFPRRNRIISGLSLGVLVVEAGLQSGSLITARLAAEQGREVWAIPGSIHHPGARGCHQLLREGAGLVESVADILESLRGWQAVAPAPRTEPGKPGRDDPLIAQLLAGPQSSEALAAALGWPLPKVLATLTEYEVEGRIAAEHGVWMVRR